MSASGGDVALQRLRGYARKTAIELRDARIEPASWTVGGETSQRTRTEGWWIFKRSVTETVTEPVRTLVEGWRLWRQVVSLTEYRLSRGFPEGGWQEERQIWLAPDGRLLSVEAKTQRWESGRGYPDQLESIADCTDSDIHFADQPWYDTPRPPRTPKGRQEGRWDSGVNLRRVPPLKPGLRISISLTDLRKAKGTYTARPDRRNG